MFLPKVTDIYQLHRVIERIHNGEFFWRGEGQTTAYIYLMAGEVELGDPGNQYLYVGENEMCAKMAARDFLDLVVEVYPEMSAYKKHLNWFPTTVILPHGQRFIFMGIDTFVLPQALKGVRFDRVFFDVSEQTQRQYDDHNDKLELALLELLATNTEVL